MRGTTSISFHRQTSTGEKPSQERESTSLCVRTYRRCCSSWYSWFNDHTSIFEEKPRKIPLNRKITDVLRIRRLEISMIVYVLHTDITSQVLNSCNSLILTIKMQIVQTILLMLSNSGWEIQLDQNWINGRRIFTWEVDKWLIGEWVKCQERDMSIFWSSSVTCKINKRIHRLIALMPSNDPWTLLTDHLLQGG